MQCVAAHLSLRLAYQHIDFAKSKLPGNGMVDVNIKI
jgi:hypothetical protein